MATHVRTHLLRIRMAYLDAFRKAMATDPFLNLVMRERDPTGKITIASLFSNAKFEELLDEITPGGTVAKSLAVSTKTYISAERIDLSELERGIGAVGEMYMARFRQMGQDQAHLIRETLAGLLEDNNSDILGSAFFANSATMPGNPAVTIDNIDGGSASGAPTVANMQADFDDALQLMAAMQNAAGRYIHSDIFHPGVPKIVIVPTDLWPQAHDAFVHKEGSSAEANRYAQMGAQVSVVPDLTDTKDWYLARGDAIFKPFVTLDEYEVKLRDNYQEGQRPDYMEAVTQLTDKLVFSAKYPFEATYGARQSIVKVDNT